MIIGMYDPENAIWTMPGGTSPRPPKDLFNSRTMKCAKEHPIWWSILTALQNIPSKKLMAHVSALVKDGMFCFGENVIVRVTPMPPSYKDGIPVVVSAEKIGNHTQFRPTVKCLWGMNQSLQGATVNGAKNSAEWEVHFRACLRKVKDARLNRMRDDAVVVTALRGI